MAPGRSRTSVSRFEARAPKPADLVCLSSGRGILSPRFGTSGGGMSMRKARTFLVGAVALLATIAAAGASAGQYGTSGLTLASSPSPFAGGPGTNYVNSEVEPWVDVNPTNPDNIIGVYQQDRWNNGGAHGLVAAVSHDGGQTWTHSWAHFSTCSGGTAANGGDFDRASDPWVTFAPNGNAYFMSLSASADLRTSAMLVAKSTDGGDSWSEPTTLIRETSDFNFNDKKPDRGPPGRDARGRLLPRERIMGSAVREPVPRGGHHLD